MKKVCQREPNRRTIVTVANPSGKLNFNPPVPNLLVVKPSSFGDIIHGLQVVESIRSQLPDTHITWIVRDIFAPLVKSAKTVDDILIYERKGGIRKFVDLLKEIRQKEYDIVLDLQGLARSGLMTAAARASLKLGRTDSRELAHLAYDQQIPLPETGKQSHAVEILLQFLPEFGLKPELNGVVEFHPAHIRPPVAEIIQKPYILLFPDSRRAEKEWPYFPELTGKLLQSHPDTQIIWAGSKSPENPPQHERFTNLIGNTSLEEVITLVSKASLVIANDSGPMHLAAAAGTPVLAIFGPTSPSLYGPYPPSRHENRVITAPEGNLKELAPEIVHQEAVDMLGYAEKRTRS